MRHAKDESKRDFAAVYKPSANSLNVKGKSGGCCHMAGLVYNEVPTTAFWRQGEAAFGNKTLRTGTAIATFVKGRYANHAHGNHAALYVRQAANGIIVADQWKADKKTGISVRLIRSLGKDKKGNFIKPSDNADAFCVIE